MTSRQKYKTPQGFKKALEHRLRQKTTSAKMSINRLRQILVFQRFLVRVFAELGERVILKGGMVLELRLERARSTKDLDLRVMGSSRSLLEELQRAGQLELDDYMTFECQEDPKHPMIEGEGVIYEGLRFQTQGYLGGKVYGTPFGVDVSFADAILGPIEVLPGDDFLEFAGLETTNFRVYPVESHIAEKLHAYTLPRKRENSRVKDLPDIALLAGSKSLNSKRTLAAIELTFSSRATHPIPVSLPKPPASWEPVYAKMAGEEELPWKTLDDVFQAACTFLNPVLSREDGLWKPESWNWKKDEE